MKTVDHRPRHAWDDRLGLPHGSVERVVHGSSAWRLAQTGVLPDEAYWADVARQLMLDSAMVKRLAEDFFSGDRLDSDLVEYIRELRLAGHPVALLSNDSPALMEKLRALEIADLFDPLIISAFIGVMKPDPRAFETALARLGRSPQMTIFIDDMPQNVTAAQALGINAVLYSAHTDLRAALAPLLLVV